MPRKVGVSLDDAFLQAILEDPDSDGPRLVYADWLEEQGNPRGTFIRLQCVRAKLTRHDPGWKELLAQEAPLLRRFEEEWSKPVARLVDAIEYRRGFIERVHVSAARFLKAAHRLLQLAPIRAVQITHIGNLLPQVLRQHCLARIRELDLSYNSLGTGILEALARAEYCRALQTLRLRRCELSPASADLLSGAANLRDLEVLDLAYNVISNEGARALAASSCLARLTELNLHGNRIDKEGAIPLADSSAFRLSKLFLGENQLGNDGAGAIFRSANFAPLRFLDLPNNAITGLGMAGLVRSPFLGQLEHLNLEHNRIGDNGAQLLASSTNLPNLIYLNLSHNEFGPAAVRSFEGCQAFPRLRELIFGSRGRS